MVSRLRSWAFAVRCGQYHLNEAQEQYVRAGLVDRDTREGEEGSAELMRMVYDSGWYPLSGA